MKMTFNENGIENDDDLINEDKHKNKYNFRYSEGSKKEDNHQNEDDQESEER